MTVAFEIPNPFARRYHWGEKWWQRPSLITIWHCDPERGGDDDSCGWTFPNLTDKQRERLKALAWCEAYEPWFQRLKAKKNDDPVQVECLMRGAVLAVCRALGIRLSWGEVCEWACRLTNTPADNFRGALCHLPGYHTNFEEDERCRREDTAFGLFSGIAVHLLAARRPWYRQPRWHIHHWRLQIHPWQTLRRWLFERCSKCGKGYSWGYCPIGNWSGTATWHHECDPSVKPQEPDARP